MLGFLCYMLLNCTTPVSADTPKPDGVKVEAFPSAPDFNLRDTKGKLVQLSDFKGQVVLINFWATWCAPCVHEMPHLQKMYKEMKGEGFVVLGINVDEARHASGIRPLSKKLGLKYPVLLDTDRSVMNIYNPSAVLPYNLVVNRKGQVYAYFEGYTLGQENEMRKAIHEALDDSK